MAAPPNVPPHVPPDVPKKKPLMRLLGEFVGHVAHGVKTDPTAPRVEEVRRQTTEEVKETPAGHVVLRRTTIEEVVLPPEGERRS